MNTLGSPKLVSVFGTAALLGVTLLAAPPTVRAQASLEEIVVTARYREESLQDAGLAIDAFSGDTLVENGVTSASDVADMVPAMAITNGGGIAAQLFLRGIGNKANNDYLDPAIILTYDGVPIALGAGGSIASFFDLERVEVLKGPQGTLYGKNATGGVMNVVPVKPQLGETGGFVNAGIGNYSAYNITGAVNLAVGDNSAFRFAGSKVEHDGWNNDGTQDEDTLSLRAQFLTELSDTFSIRVAADYADFGGVGSGTTAVGSYTPAGGLANYAFVPSGLAPNEGQNTPAGNAYRQTILAAPGFGFLTPINEQYYVDGQITGVNAEINIGSGIGDFTIIPAYRKIEQDSQFGHPGFNNGWWNTSADQTSLEARLSGQGSELLDYLVGAYFITQDLEGNNTFNQEFVLPLQDYTQSSDSWAVFSQLTWNLTDATRLITGVRYTDDHKEMNGQINNYITFCGGLPPNLITPPASFQQGCAAPGGLPHYPTLDTPAEADAFLVDNGWASTFIPIPPGFLIPLDNGVGQILHAVSENNSDYDNNKVSWRLALEHNLGEDSLLYASVESGYRSGGLEPQTGAPYEPEYLDAYTIGAKSRLAGGRLQVNAEVFFWDYTDQQISYFTLTDEGVLENNTENVGKSTNQGFDVDVQWLATDDTLITGQLQYLDASYDDLYFETGPPRDNINCPFEIIGTLSDGVTPALRFNCSGNQSIFSPEWTVMFGIEQTFHLGSFDLVAGLDSTWRDDQVTGFQNLPHEVIKAHTMTNVDLTLVSSDGVWSVGAYARNLEDKARILATQPPLLGAAMAQYGPELTYGIRANFNF